MMQVEGMLIILSILGLLIVFFGLPIALILWLGDWLEKKGKAGED